jgi:Protein of unknown function (DUF1275)
VAGFLGVTLPHLLSLTAGFVDTAGFLVLQGLFAANLIGNFVTLGASLVLGTSGGMAKLLALPVFCSRLRGRGPALYPVRMWHFVVAPIISGHHLFGPVAHEARVVNGFVRPLDCLRFEQTVRCREHGSPAFFQVGGGVIPYWPGPNLSIKLHAASVSWSSKCDRAAEIYRRDALGR